MIAIFCDSPYQLYNAINLAFSFGEKKCYLFLTEKMFNSSKKFIVKENAFIKKVELIPRYYDNNLIIKVFDLVTSWLFGYNYFGFMRTIPNFKDYKDIDKIICTKFSNFAFDFAKYYTKKYNKKIKVYLVEEGIGEYLVANGIINKKNRKYVEKIYLSEPKLNHNDNIPKEKSPKINETKEFNKIIDEIFNYSDDLNKYKRYIYFGQAFYEDYNIIEFVEKESKIMKILNQSIRKNMTVKLHPRKVKDSKSVKDSIETNCPWECIVNQLENIDDRVLISISSTSLITPKLIADKEPYIICTIKIFENAFKNVFSKYDYYNKNVLLFEEVKKMYKHPEKVYFPESIDEFKKILLQIEGIKNEK